MLEDSKEHIRRGDIYYANLDPVKGSEQGGIRPVIVLQSNDCNISCPTVTVVPLTSKPKKLRLHSHVAVPKTGLMKCNSYALLEQIRTLDKSRLLKYWGHVDDEVMVCIDVAIGRSMSVCRSIIDKPIELCLCSVCARDFYNTPGFVIRRKDFRQYVKESCDYCTVRRGFDYLVWSRKSNVQNMAVEQFSTFEEN